MAVVEARKEMVLDLQVQSAREQEAEARVRAVVVSVPYLVLVIVSLIRTGGLCDDVSHLRDGNVCCREHEIGHRCKDECLGANAKGKEGPQMTDGERNDAAKNVHNLPPRWYWRRAHDCMIDVFCDKL